MVASKCFSHGINLMERPHNGGHQLHVKEKMPKKSGSKNVKKRTNNHEIQ